MAILNIPNNTILTLGGTPIVFNITNKIAKENTKAKPYLSCISKHLEYHDASADGNITIIHKKVIKPINPNKICIY